MTSSTQHMKSKTFIFFSLQCRRLATSFEGLNCSIEQPGELWNWKVAWKWQLNVWFQSTNISYTSTVKMLKQRWAI